MDASRVDLSDNTALQRSSSSAKKGRLRVASGPKSREETPKEEGQQQREAPPHRNKIRCVAQRAKKKRVEDRPNLRQDRVALCDALPWLAHQGNRSG